VIAAEERRWILSLVARLSDVQRDALALRFAGGLSSREIAPVIGKSEAATKKLLTRALAALKEATRNDA
jgi:RNA polymerase sigma-70 factor, ECF subfamily